MSPSKFPMKTVQVCSSCSLYVCGYCCTTLANKHPRATVCYLSYMLFYLQLCSTCLPWLEIISVHVILTVTENSRTSWHLINIRIRNLQEYVLNYVYKGTRLLLSGRLEYSQTKTREGATKDLAVVVVGE